MTTTIEYCYSHAVGNRGCILIPVTTAGPGIKGAAGDLPLLDIIPQNSYTSAESPAIAPDLGNPVAHQPVLGGEQTHDGLLGVSLYPSKKREEHRYGRGF